PYRSVLASRFTTGKNETMEGPQLSMSNPDQMQTPAISTPPSRLQAAAGLDENDLGLLGYFQILSRHKGALLVSAFAGALAGLLIALPQTPLYQARVSLEIQGLNENFLNMKDFSPTSTGSVSYPDFDIQTQVRILESHSLAARVLEKLDKEKQSELARDPGRLSTWKSALGLSSAQPVSRARALEAVAAHLRVKSSNTNRIVEVFFDAPDPQLAAEFANTLANEFIEQNLEARWKATERTGQWLTRQLADLKTKLEKSEDELQAYAQATHLLFTGDREKENVSEEKLRQLQAELTKAQSDRVAKQSKFELANSAPAESLPEVLDDLSLRDSQIKLTDLRRQRAELSTALTPAHYKVQRIEAQIAELEADLKKNRTNILSRIHNEFEASQRREKLLAADYAAQSALVSKQAGKTIHYNILKREVDTNRQLYEGMLQRVKEAGVASAMRASGIHVVDPATPPSAPYRPDVPRSSAMGLLAGFFVGAAFFLMREKADRTLQQPGDAPAYLRLPELGVIPAAKLDRVTGLYDRPGSLRGSLADMRMVSAKQPEEPLELVAWRHKPSMMADSFRGTITSIIFSKHLGDRPRVLVLTSANPGEGKTTVVTNLAIALTEISRRVLLIDADMRRPRIHELFDLKNDCGLSDLLKARTPLNRDPVDVMVQHTEVPGLYALPSGSVEAGASDLLYSPRLAELLIKMRGVFDTILIDTPPMLHLPDARVLGKLSDAVVMVLRAGETTRDVAGAACQRFREDGTPLLGTILNGWNPALNGYGYDYKHYEAYYARRNGKAVR
ncbi:MAG: lipopolysaccharide biosynthesis, partial [Bryobacterales bacterium]|nr:lipopolysaccharide biosynthesis [Bryobacterales bacterium]